MGGKCTFDASAMIHGDCKCFFLLLDSSKMGNFSLFLIRLNFLRTSVDKNRNLSLHFNVVRLTFFGLKSLKSDYNGTAGKTSYLFAVEEEGFLFG